MNTFTPIKSQSEIDAQEDRAAQWDAAWDWLLIITMFCVCVGVLSLSKSMGWI